MILRPLLPLPLPKPLPVGDIQQEEILSQQKKVLRELRAARKDAKEPDGPKGSGGGGGWEWVTEFTPCADRCWGMCRENEYCLVRTLVYENAAGELYTADSTIFVPRHRFEIERV